MADLCALDLARARPGSPGSSPKALMVHSSKVGSIENPEYLDPTFSAVQNHFREVVHKTIGAEGDT